MGNQLRSPTNIGHLSLSDNSTDDYLYVNGVPITGGGGSSYDLNLENGTGTYSLVQKEGDTSTGESDDRKNYAYGRSDAAFGHKNKTYQRDAFAFGGGNKVGLTENEFLELYPSGVDGSGKNYSGSYSFSIAIGENNIITSRSSSALGVRNEVSGQGSVALGGENNVTGSYSLAAGSRSSATGIYSVAVGQAATASNQASFAVGYSTLSSGVASVAEGDRAVASGRGAHAEGTRNTASGNGAHAEGYMSDPAIGSYGLASGIGSHAENVNNIAKGVGSHAGGCYSIAQGPYHFVHGSYLISSDTGETQAVFGKYNADNVSAVFVVGNGTAENARSNAFEVTHTGIARAYGTPVGDNDLTPKSYVDARVSANPAEAGATDLTKLKVGNTVYNIPSGVLYKHKVSFVDDEFNFITLYIISSSITPITFEYLKTHTSILETPATFDFNSSDFGFIISVNVSEYMMSLTCLGLGGTSQAVLIKNETVLNDTVIQL